MLKITKIGSSSDNGSINPSDIVLDLPLISDKNDVSSNNHSTIENDVIYYPDGALLDENTDYIKVNDSEDLSFTTGTSDKPFSISCDFITCSSNSLQRLVSKDDTTVFEYSTYYQNNNLTFVLNSQSIGSKYKFIWTNSISLVKGVSYNIIFTYDGTNNVSDGRGGTSGMSIYVNGVKATTSFDYQPGYISMLNTTTSVWVGKNTTSTSETLTGSIKNIKIYKVCLTQLQVTNIQPIVIHEISTTKLYVPFYGNIIDKSSSTKSLISGGSSYNYLTKPRWLTNSINNVYQQILPSGNVLSMQMDGSSLDTIGHTVVDTDISYSNGSAVFNGTTSKMIVSGSDLGFTDGTKDLPFTIDIRLSFSVIGVQLFLSSHTSDNTGLIILYYDHAGGRIQFYVGLSGSGFIQVYIPFVPTVDVMYRFTATYDGTNYANGMNLYLNGVKQITYTGGPDYSGFVRPNVPYTFSLGYYESNNTFYNIKVDYCNVYNKVLTQEDINKGITDLSFYSGTTDLPFSISFKYNFGSNSNVSWFNKSNGTNVEYSIKYDTTLGIVVVLRDNTNNSECTYNKLFTPIIGQNYLFAVTYDGTIISLYINGVLQTATNSFNPNNIKNSLVSVWEMNSINSGIILDELGKHQLNSLNSPTITNGILGNAISLSNVGSNRLYAYYNGSTSQSTFHSDLTPIPSRGWSVSMWVNYNSMTNCTFFYKSTDSANYPLSYDAVIYNSKIYFSIYEGLNNDNKIQVGFDITLNSNFNHLVFTYDGSIGVNSENGINIFYNGVKLINGTRIRTGFLTGCSVDTTNVFTIGTWYNSLPVVPIVDQTCVWKKELSSSEVSFLYNNRNGRLYSNWNYVSMTSAIGGTQQINITSGVKNTNNYGYLYNGYAALNSLLAPIGWHIPTQTEYNTLFSYLGGNSVAGGHLKETGTTHWGSPNTGADNSSGFSGLPGGIRYGDNGTFYPFGTYGHYWTSTSGCMMVLDTSVASTGFYNGQTLKHGVSVRCIKDNNTPTVGGVTYDIDGNSYTEVIIGTQIWMVQNLAVTKYNDGTPIQNITNNTTWTTLTNGSYCSYNNDDRLVTIKPEYLNGSIKNLKVESIIIPQSTVVKYTNDAESYRVLDMQFNNNISLKSNLLNVFEFDEPTGNSYCSYDTNLACSHNGTQLNQVGKLNKSLLITGTSRTFFPYIGSDSRYSFTDGVKDIPKSFSCWVNFNGVNASGENYIFYKGNFPYNHYRMMLTGGYLYFEMGDGTALWTNTKGKYVSFSPVLGNWYFFTFEYNGDGKSTADGMSISINGVVQNCTSSFSGTYTKSSLYLNVGTNMIGNYPDVDKPLNGKIDQVCVWDKVLTQSHRDELYNNGSGKTYSTWSGDLNNTDLMGHIVNHSGMTYVNNSAVFVGTTPYSVNSKISISNSSDLSFTNGTKDLPFSIDIRFTVNNSSGVYTLFSKQNEYYGTVYTNGYFYFHMHQQGTNFQPSLFYFNAAFVNGVTYRLTITYDGRGGISPSNGVNAYVNNVLVVSPTRNDGSCSHMNPTNNPLLLGQSIGNVSPYFDGLNIFNGTIDYCTIYNRVLIQDELVNGICNTYTYKIIDAPLTINEYDINGLVANFGVNTTISGGKCNANLNGINYNDSDNFTFVNGVNHLPFSFSVKYKQSSIVDADYCFLNKGYTYTMNEYFFGWHHNTYWNTNYMYVKMFSGPNTEYEMTWYFNCSILVNTYTTVGFTYDGGFLSSSLKVYVNGIPLSLGANIDGGTTASFYKSPNFTYMSNSSGKLYVLSHYSGGYGITGEFKNLHLDNICHPSSQMLDYHNGN